MLAAQQIVAAIVARLIAAGTDAGSNVFSDRLWPLDESKLPAFRVYETSDEIANDTIHWPQLQKHDTDIVVEACGSDTSGIDATLASLRLQVEQALFDTINHATLGLAGVTTYLRSVGPMKPIEAADKQVASREIHINAQYRTLSNAPEAFA